MKTRLSLEIRRQPDDRTCGPTCLHAVYRYHGDDVDLDTVIDEVPALEDGGTLAVYLAIHALRRGYGATIHTFNLQVFDPTWFSEGVDLRERLLSRAAAKDDPKLGRECEALVEFLDLGGRIVLDDFTGTEIRRHLRRNRPILTGLSATWLYRTARERPEDEEADDVHGEPAGHFVVVCGYDAAAGLVRVADPYLDHPFDAEHVYDVGLDRLLCAILLGVLTFDGNLLILDPPRRKKRTRAPGRTG